MRRSDKEIMSRAEIDAIVHGCDVCRLGFAAGNEPYVVPLSFGYDGRELYFHTARTGRKIDCIEVNNRACFELERNVELIRDPDQPCEWSFAFESVIGFGTVHELTTDEDRERGLNRIMEHYSGRRWRFDPTATRGVRVWRLVIESITGKRSDRKGGS
jgi:nitroimidazol reductase NimA-like FMN-containing flavoprotein (pyridoxamine 5'-phosphate oxidase superfamily)